MNRLAEELKARIAAHGPIGVDDFMAAANAHYYGTRDPFGPAGDFVTAPEISQMFGEIVGAALTDAWSRAGRPNAAFVELGPGRGTLAADALRVMRRAGFRGEVHLVESSETLRGVQRTAVPDAIFHPSLDSLPAAPLLLVANEFFDALPVRQWCGDTLRRVGHDGTRFLFVGQEVTGEDSPARDAVATRLGHHLAQHGGAALIIDYGYAGGERGDTLQAVRGHAPADPLDRPGEQDLTAHVDFAGLAAEARNEGVVISRVVSQGSWLETLGIGPRAATLAAIHPDRTQEIAAARRRLCDEEEMGRLFKVMGLTAVDWPRLAGLE